MTTPFVAIIGRPNVGKSTLFNRLAGEPLAIVSDVPGTTRDRVTSTVYWRDRSIILVDTGGLEVAPTSTLWEQVREQVHTALDQADAIIFMTDVVDGVTPADVEIAQMLRERGTPLVLAVNKVDNPKREQQTVDFYQLGLGDPVPISAFHNLGIGDLIIVMDELLPEPSLEDGEATGVKLAIVGRPNVGKSLLINKILGNDRTIVSDIPGTTRDAIDISLSFNDRPITLIDTAGVRRRGSVEAGIEKYSVLRTLRAIDRANVCMLITDATEAITSQDTHIAGQVLESYRGVVVVVNKWDLVRGEMEQSEMAEEVRRKLRFMSYVPICFTSALLGTGVQEAVETALKVYQAGLKVVDQQQLTKVLLSALAGHMPPSRAGKPIKIYRIAQKGSNPPTFVLPVNNPELVHFSYKRYLENQLRSAFGFEGNPVRLIFAPARTRGKAWR